MQWRLVLHFRSRYDRLAFLGLERIFLRDGIDSAIEDVVLRILCHQVFGAELLQARFTFGCSRVDFALHEIVLVVDLRQSAGRLDKDQTIHAVGNVLRDHRTAAVVKEQSRRRGQK